MSLFVVGCAAAWPQTFSFQPPVSYPAQGGPLAAITADFNGDGKPDLAVANAASSTVTIFLGKGDGTFTPESPITIPGGCFDDNLTAGDFNHDGKMDLLAVCGFQTTVWVLPGLGNGQFGPPVSSLLPQSALQGFAELSFHSVAVADFNRDGNLDLVVITAANVETEEALSTVELNLLLGKGDGTFQTATTLLPETGFLGLNVVTGDFDGDGNPDLATDIYTVVAGGSSGPQTVGIQILRGDGKGGFTPDATYSIPGAPLAGSMILADVNHDGKPDLIVAGGIGPKIADFNYYITVLLSNGDGTFKQLPSTSESEESCAMVAADFLGTGTPALVQELFPPGDLNTGLPIGSFRLTIRAGNGDGTFQAPVPMTVPLGYSPFSFSLPAGDWNGDGLPDLALTASPSGVTLVGQKGGLSGFAQLVQLYQGLPAGELVTLLNNLPPPAPMIALSNQQLQFSATAGGVNPPSQSVTVSNDGGGTLNWTATSSATWLSVTPKSGTGSGMLTISAAVGAMGAGTYPATISIAASGATNGPLTISVTFTVSAPSNLPTITAVVNGASFQAGIESGSWVTIFGTNLSNTNPGRTWLPNEIINGNLPTMLDGTSVTIDGKAAYVYYISPTQLDVQAPTDSATGSVAVVVTNNGQMSVAFMAQLQTYTPAFFLYGGTSYAIATHYPDYALVANPGVIPGTVAAHPGDVLILWATGFGPTNPATPAGIAVTVAAGAATLPTVTVGGVGVTMIGVAESPGSAGLYQVAIQLPPNVPTGVVQIQASVGGVTSPTGVLIDVASQ